MSLGITRFTPAISHFRWPTLNEFRDSWRSELRKYACLCVCEWVCEYQPRYCWIEFFGITENSKTFNREPIVQGNECNQHKYWIANTQKYIHSIKSTVIIPSGIQYLVVCPHLNDQPREKKTHIERERERDAESESQHKVFRVVLRTSSHLKTHCVRKVLLKVRNWVCRRH